jgi:threonine/homoserine/homoserine lactone efflux protein
MQCVDHAQAFLVFAFVAAVTPGPSNVMLTATGAQAGIRRGLPCLLGVGAGMGAMMSLVALGLGALIVASPLVAVILKGCGAVFLLWLAWKIASSGEASAVSSRTVGFLGAALFQWMNPKSWLVATSAAGTYLDPQASPLVQALWIGGLFVAAALPSGFLWLAAGVALQRVMRSPRWRRAFNVAMGALLAASVAWLFV